LARYFSNPRIRHRLSQNEAVMKYDCPTACQRGIEEREVRPIV
jgi:hypothetical protein